MNEDQAFIAEVPELPGCSADGKAHRDGLHNVEGIIQEWLETDRVAETAGAPGVLPLHKNRKIGQSRVCPCLDHRVEESADAWGKMALIATHSLTSLRFSKAISCSNNKNQGKKAENCPQLRKIG